MFQGSKSQRSSLAALAAAMFVSFTAGIVPAAAVFSVQTDNWFVFSLTNSCIAGNRPPAEYNFSPWNSLTLHAPKDGGLKVEVTFWPGLLKQDQAPKLKLHAEGRKEYVLDAKIVNGYSLQTVQPVGDEFIKGLSGSKLLQVSATGVPERLGFDISHSADVLKALDDCRKTLGG